ncbi:MAG: FAD binding domain-containing protein [Candidatus Bathyarchaeia archaeon]
MSVNRINTHIIPTRFEYHAPNSLGEALELLSEYGGEAKLLAGGTDLLVKMKQRLTAPNCVIDIKRIDGLNRIEEREDGIHIGAATTLGTIERSDVVKAEFPLLHEAVRSIGSVQIRNMATIGGNLCNASPAADSAVALLALDAKARMISPEGVRLVPMEEFFTGPGETVLETDEILTGVSVPYLPEGTGTSFMKIGRTSLDIATINIAVVLKMVDGVVEDCRIALGAVASTPLRVKRAEAFLRVNELTSENLEVAAEMVAEDIRPITDIRATAEYRREASKTLTKDALTLAGERSLGGR